MKSIIFNSIPFYPYSRLQVKALSFLLVDIPNWKVCFLRAEDIFLLKSASMEELSSHLLPYEIVYFKVYFKFCALGSVFVRERPSACTTYFLICLI